MTDEELQEQIKWLDNIIESGTGMLETLDKMNPATLEWLDNFLELSGVNLKELTSIVSATLCKASIARKEKCSQ